LKKKRLGLKAVLSNRSGTNATNHQPFGRLGGGCGSRIITGEETYAMHVVSCRDLQNPTHISLLCKPSHREPLFPDLT